MTTRQKSPEIPLSADKADTPLDQKSSSAIRATSMGGGWHPIARLFGPVRTLVRRAYLVLLERLAFRCTASRLVAACSIVEPPTNTKQATERGDHAAQYNLGLMFLTGQGAPRDLPAAARCFRAASEQDNPLAQTNLGCMLLTGQGTATDRKQAIECFGKAAAQGFAPAQYVLDQIASDSQRSSCSPRPQEKTAAAGRALSSSPKAPAPR